MSSSAKLFEPFTLGDIQLKHRVVMAPMTRLRAGQEDGIPSEWAAEYYSSRATEGGLIVTEASITAPSARVWPFQPGLWSEDQVAGWRKVTDAVHAKGGKIIAQIAAAGRVAVPGFSPIIYAPSNVHDPTPGAPQPELTVMTEEDIARNVIEHTEAAKNAIKAGFDGVEIHVANGYLLDQFVQSVSNHRTDAYGGSISNRIRFPLQIVRSVSAAIGPSKTGLRISPFGTFQGMREPSILNEQGFEISGPVTTFSTFLEAVYQEVPDFGYIHAVEPRVSGAEDQSTDKINAKDTLQPFREVVEKHDGKLLVAGGYNAVSAREHAEKYDDLVVIGRYFTSNPDLIHRIKNDLPIVKYDRNTFYTQGKEGYLGWPTYDQQAAIAGTAQVKVEAATVQVAA
ncbi:uncharacterized protein I303_107558 [Kwoniella dejecticola CBS 10117]|uniref:NADH:flavin oxidoreductase/NADH oxidase N-terminal domain-containing protein n=1 Tax=Kwoniella dejecticola CBS 10117 TaxID=1296121 RepID=A0A1A5ZV22_9TREE|nr:uncharacterized protein I303_07568 [Kwoniella dejecticola CBS 10117]OBR81658.1 hypothetical protein I303_07568 [Kwoniella dejecticola CBS 10117]